MDNSVLENSKYVEQLRRDKNNRLKSFDHCRSFFIENRYLKDKYGEIALHLYAYLASWGMLRNSFLLQKDYLFLKPVVEILCKEEYSFLLNLDVFNCDVKKISSLIIKVSKEIENYFLGERTFNGLVSEDKPIQHVTDTQLTKILLGTYGCIPAFDQYFVKGMSKELNKRSFNECTIGCLIDYAIDKQEDIEAYKKENGLSDLYTPMKILDMWFWEYGYRLSLNK